MKVRRMRRLRRMESSMVKRNYMIRRIGGAAVVRMEYSWRKRVSAVVMVRAVLVRMEYAMKRRRMIAEMGRMEFLVGKTSTNHLEIILDPVTHIRPSDAVAL